MMNKIEHFCDDPMFEEHWFNFSELYKFVVEKYPSGSSFVEVGSWKGRSSAYMCVEIANSDKDIKFFCIDTWEGSNEHNADQRNNLYKKFMFNMKSVKNYFSAIKMTSVEASRLFPDQSLDFVFIDGSHEYTDVLTDINVWYPKVKPGGILAGDDYCDGWPGVKRAVQESFDNFVVNGGCWAVFLK
jgi:predicted O-methyltransferase YrrM